MMLYKIMLSLFIFGLVAGAINAAGICSVAVPESGVTIGVRVISSICGPSTRHSATSPVIMVSITNRHRSRLVCPKTSCCMARWR